MKRRSGRWSAPTALAVSLALAWHFALSVPGVLAAGEEQAAAQDTGTSLGSLIGERFGSRDKLRERIANPLTSSGTPLETLDGSRRFDAQLFFPSSRRFLEIFAQPSATGDLGTVVVGQDLDLNGSIDFSFGLPFPVSGVCANGVIACAPGTWTSCRYHRWNAAADGRLSLIEASPVELGGCYCINADCGSDLVWQNLPVVLQGLGGGAAGAVQGARPGFSVSRVEVGGTTIAYYGQDTSRQVDPATGETAPAQTPTQAAYYRTPFALPGDAQALAASQSGDTGSLPSLITGFSAGQQQNACQIRRQVSLHKPAVEEVIAPLGGTGSVQPCGAECIDVILGRVGDNYWVGSCTIYEEDFRVMVKQPDLIQSATLKRAKWDDYLQVWIGGALAWSGPNGNFPPETAGACELSTSWDQNPKLDVTSYFKSYGEIQTRIRVSVTGKGEGFAIVRIQLPPNMCVADTAVSDGCAGLAARPDCTLFEERVDGVYTVRNANPTGLVPLPSSQTFTQAECTETLTRDWWEKRRVYLCSTPGFDFSDARTRFGQVVGTVAQSGGVGTYLDMVRGADGSWTASTGTVGLPEAPPADECEKACRTRRPKSDTQALLTGHTAQKKTSTDSFDFFYRQCKEDICPAGEGEEIVKDCQCLNDFPEAATIMQTLRLAGKDTICSDGVPKTPTPR